MCAVCLSVCLSVSLHLSVPGYLSERPDSSKYARINEAMIGVLTCQRFIYSAGIIHLSAKQKPKPKSEV